MTIDILLPKLAKPAQRALQNAGITTLEQLAGYSEKDLSQLHGIGKNALITIHVILKTYGLSLADS